MFFTHIVENPQFYTFQTRVEGLCRVIVCVASRKLFFSMIHPIVRSKCFTHCAIGLKLIGHQMRFLIHKASDVRQKICEFVTFYWYSPNWAIAFNRYKHSLLFSTPATLMFDSVLVSWFTTKIFLIQFDDTLQCWNQFRSRIHHFPNGMAKFPSAFLRDTHPLA